MTPQHPLNIQIRYSQESDYKQIADIYNHYVVNTTATMTWHKKSEEQLKAYYSIFNQDGPYFLLVAESKHEIIGYVASHPFDLRKDGYRLSVETSIYCKHGMTQKGVGKALYEQLFELLINKEIHRVYARISLPNPASISFHKSFDFRQVATLNEVAKKFDRYIDVALYEKKLGRVDNSLV